MQQALVSVIIPTYNVEQFIEETLDSVLAQTYPHIEIIITDDGSTDRTVQIARTYESLCPGRLKLVTSPVNTGISTNFNRGLAVRTGKYICWLGGDDLMLPDKIAKQVSLLESRPDAVGCCHDAEVFESDSGVVLGTFSELYNGRTGFREGGIEILFDPGRRMLPSTIMFRASACPSEGFDERLVFANDWLFDIALFRQGKCAVLNETLGRYRRHAGNITAMPGTRSRALEESLIVLGIVDARYPELHHLTRMRRTSLFLTEAVKAFSTGDRSRFKQYIRRSMFEGAFARALLAYVGCHLFRSTLTANATRPVYQMPRWFVRMVNLFRGRA